MTTTELNLPCQYCGGQIGHVTCHQCGTHVPILGGLIWTNPVVEDEADRTGATPDYGPGDVRLYCDACYPKASGL